MVTWAGVEGRLNMCEIKFTYENDEELRRFIDWLGSMAVKVKHKEKRGRFKRAYILLKDIYKLPDKL